MVESETLEQFEDTFVKIVFIVSSKRDVLKCLTAVLVPAELFQCQIINTIKDTNFINGYKVI